MRDNDPPPEEFRCKRTDGRQWRCKRRAMDGKTLCDIHHLQGKHRQNKQKVPESLKLKRTVTKKRGNVDGESSRRVSKTAKEPLATAESRRVKVVSEKLDEALKRMKLKRGDLHLDLIRGFLKRQVEKKKEKELKESELNANSQKLRDQTRVLPYGVLAISQSHSNSQKLCENGDLDLKVEVDSSGRVVLQRHFRSKNIEPLPISTMQVVPLAENGKAKKIWKCHWCRGSKCNSLIKCLTCRKRFFCLNCIKERYFEKQEVKTKCPACRGTFSCTLCMKLKLRTSNHKVCYRGGRKLDRKQLLHYLLYMLLPVLKKLNHDQITELETESKVTGKEQSKILIPETELGFLSSCCCNKCKRSIVDYHRTCTNCSYNLCLSCCQELSRNKYGSFKPNNFKKRKICGEGILVKHNTSRNNSEMSSFPLEKWETSVDGSIPCPSTEAGGCGGSLLGLRRIYPFNWTRDLELKAEELLCSYHLPKTADISSCCSSCKELSQRIGFNNSYLYSPSLKDLHQETLEHFQSHWGKGHPVIVRDLLRANPGLCWDPFVMFCSYMENKSSESCNGGSMKATNSLDWCEVEIDRKRIFMGSLENRTHASLQKKVLKFKAWLSSDLFQKHFPIHYNEISIALPLPEYVHPVSGLLNIGLKLAKDLSKPNLGPSIYFSYGGPEELMQADYLSKLCYESHDTVNILAYATDAPISSEQITKIENLMKKNKTLDHGQSFSNFSDQKGKSSLQSEDTGESGLLDFGEKTVLPIGIGNVPFYSSDHPPSVENGNFSDESEYDSEASILCSESIENSEDFDDHFLEEDIESSFYSKDKQGTDCCGAQWDIFPREDVPKLLEYIKRHSKELSSGRSYTKHVHPILDQSFFLDAYHKLRLKEEYDIQPWTFEQCTGEAVFIPAGCPYQIRKIKGAYKLFEGAYKLSQSNRLRCFDWKCYTASLFFSPTSSDQFHKSCVNVVLDFVSPENATKCIQLNDEIRLLPTRHKAKSKIMEVEKMALQGISAAIEDLCNLIPQKQ